LAGSKPIESDTYTFVVGPKKTKINVAKDKLKISAKFKMMMETHSKSFKGQQFPEIDLPYVKYESFQILIKYLLNHEFDDTLDFQGTLDVAALALAYDVPGLLKLTVNSLKNKYSASEHEEIVKRVIEEQPSLARLLLNGPNYISI
ncbi:hypothetical protein HK099_001567, partial [Clydaea vesicula]